MVRTVGWVLALGVVASASVGRAQEMDEAPPEEAPAEQPTESGPDEATARADEEARNLFQAGRLALESGRFEDAYEHFSRAYELSPHPGLLHNMGLAADRLNRYEEALDAYRRYADSGEAHNEPELRARIEVLERTLAEQREDPGGDVAVEAESEGPSVLWTFVAGGVAVVSWGLTIGFFAASEGSFSDLEDSCGARGCTEQEIDDSGIETTQTLTNVFLVTALVATAATGAILALELTSGGGDSSEAAAQLRLGPTGASVTGRF